MAEIDAETIAQTNVAPVAFLHTTNAPNIDIASMAAHNALGG